jgi:A/G-specific adenine glycosylase
MSKRPSRLSGDQPNPDITRRLLRWFARHEREMPWRAARGEPRDPYHVWLAEVMLQQTQVATVIPYYRRWLERFPTLNDLAAAPVDDVLKLWEGLGYYSRARNFHRAAQAVVSEYGGRVPDTVEELRKLSGVGPYTAGAIASLAFGRDAPVLDGNVARVLSRVFALDKPPSEPRAKEHLWELAEALLPQGRAGEFNEALMDLGATTCTPRSPQCPECPINTHCSAYANGNPEGYPVKAAKKAVPQQTILTAVIVDSHGRMLMAQRPHRGLLGGLWEFPGGVTEDGGRRTGEQRHKVREEQQSYTAHSTSEWARQLGHIVRERTGVRISVGAGDFVGQVDHAFSHLRTTRHVALVRTSDATGDLAPDATGGDDYNQVRWVSREEIERLALTRSDHKILALVFGSADRPRLL